MTHSLIPQGFLTALRQPTRITDADSKRLPRISIVMPSFNQVEFIERSILSVLNQEYPNLQLIIIDGGSTDGTSDVLKRYDAHIDFWVSEPDQGQSDALNKGFREANGEIHGWLNSDDLYLPGALIKVARSFDADPVKKVVIGDWLEIDGVDNVIGWGYAFDYSSKHLIYEGWHIHPQAMFWSREVHERFGGFDIDLHTNMDVQMAVIFGRNEGNRGFQRIPFFLGAWRRRPGQITGHSNARALRDTALLELRYGLGARKTGCGRAMRFLYRFRRAYWYVKRGGMEELIRRLKNAYG